MLEEPRDRAEIIERVAGLDIGEAEVVVCADARPVLCAAAVAEIATYSSMTRSLLRLADRLHELG